jgi:folate-binding protein YgfZ
MLDAVAATDTELSGAEHHTLAEGCGLLDRSERGKLALSGSGTVEFLNGQVTNELADLQPGEGRYAAFLTHKGKMLGDLRILAVTGASTNAVPPTVGGDAPASPALELLLDTERVALQELFDMIRRFKVGYDVELHKRTLERGLLSLIGPRAPAFAGAERLANCPEHTNTPVELGGIGALASRTDVGIDLLCDAADTARLDGALRARGARPVSEQAAECIRVEHGRPRFGIDIDQTTIPQEAGLNERAVSFTKGCYVGQETVARLHWKGKPNRHLRGLHLSAPASSGEQLYLGERVVGQVGSFALSPHHGPIALALVRREAEPGATVLVGDSASPAEVVELPFSTTTS